jgi:transcriptional regulator with XRE-family HTH domain
MHLHEELRKAREKAGLTQAELAKLAGIPRNQIVRAEKGDNITLDTLRTITAQLPLTSLTLMENVMLTADLLPQPAKIYLGAMATLSHMTQAMGAALNLAMAARVAMETARRADPIALAAGLEDLQDDDLLILKSIETWYRELQKTILETADLGAPGSEPQS